MQLGERTCRSPEEFKAWSQNLGHEQVLTTFTSYGAVSAHRQAELIRGLSNADPGEPTLEALLKATLAKFGGTLPAGQRLLAHSASGGHPGSGGTPTPVMSRLRVHVWVELLGGSMIGVQCRTSLIDLHN